MGGEVRGGEGEDNSIPCLKREREIAKKNHKKKPPQTTIRGGLGGLRPERS